MRPYPYTKIWLYSIITFGFILVFLGRFDTIYTWHWQHIQLHTAIETLGAMTAVLIAMILFRESRNRPETHLIMLATGFASMGVLDLAHAISRPGDAFIFLHSVAGLSGGFFFTSVWFTRGRQIPHRSEARIIFLGFIILSASVGLRALIFPEDVPKLMPLFDGKFTMAAVLINITAGLLFFAAAPKLYRVYRQQRHDLDLLLVHLTMLFGTAAVIFPFSTPWNGVWWAWHLIRLGAFLGTLFFVFSKYGGTIADAAANGRDKR